MLSKRSCLLAIFCVLSASVGSAVRAAEAPRPPVALVTGSDRGIGFALTQELVSRGWRVVATCREPSRAKELEEFAKTHPLVGIERLDVGDNAAIDELAQKYKAQPIDALINNAGITGDFDAQQLATFDPDVFQQVMRINAYAPLRISRAFLEQVVASRQKKIISISSGSGSLWQAPQAPSPTYYYYNKSKSALNMGMRVLQSDVRARGVLVGLVTPGPVATDMQKEVRDNAVRIGWPLTTAILPVADSARALADYVEHLGPEKAGRFYSYTGAETPW